MKDVILNKDVTHVDEQTALKIDIVNMLFSTNTRSTIIAVIVSLTLAYIVYDQVKPAILIGWLVIFLFVYAIRFFLILSFYRRANDVVMSPQHWLTLFRLSTLACGMSWGFAGFYLLSDTSGTLYQAFVTLVIVGVTGGAMVMYAIDSMTSRLFSGSLYLLSLPGYITQPTEISIAMAILLAVYIIYVSLASASLAKKLRENILLHQASLRQKAEIEKLAQHQQIHIDHTPMGVIEWSLDLTVVSWNNSAERIFGYTESEALGHDASFILPTELYSDVKNKLLGLINNGSSISCQNENITKLSERIFCEWTFTALRNTENQVIGLASLVQNKTEFKKNQDEIRYLAYYDTLTDLPNRRLLSERINRALLTSHRSKTYCAVFFIDLDNFKNINDLYGHSVGDMLLKIVSERLRTVLRDEDTIARFGGDEFVILIENLSTKPSKSRSRAEYIANKIILAISDNYTIGNVQYRSSCSIGICTFVGNSLSVNEIFKHADNAMFQAKSDGRNCSRFFDEKLQPSIEYKASLESDLRNAIFGQDLVPYFQPQVDSTHTITGAEILLRWKHPKHGMIPPVEFIPIAEESDMINVIGKEILNAACQQLYKWQEIPDKQHLFLSVNISAKQFMQKNFVDSTLTIIDKNQCPANRLRLEITESLMLKNIDELALKIDQLRAQGITLSLDDFGTGYSSLSLLRSFNLDEIKIDKSFVDHMLQNSSDAHIIKTIITMSTNMGMNIIAEGVETVEQEQFLAHYGCLHYQGYLFGKPMSIDDFEKHISHNT
ncbi:MAG TPA: EAL domain-containing protein [Methylophaga aminisulfidivorans]|uniref:EAL domain-containing protein n=2 Tax=root TaxID=1 RepID=A0A7C2AGL7_9GAMM|nr:EAL domain-containing protein [Methylophaga aminisulfidivorans]